VPIYNLVLGFFGTYGGILCQSGSCTLQYLWWYAVPIWFLVSGFWILDSGFFDVSLMFALMFASVLCSGFFPVGWKRQPEEGGIAPGCCGGGVITAWAAGDGVIAAGSAV
jgi:hypothetical protein